MEKHGDELIAQGVTKSKCVRKANRRKECEQECIVLHRTTEAAGATDLSSRRSSYKCPIAMELAALLQGDPKGKGNRKEHGVHTAVQVGVSGGYPGSVVSGQIA